MKFDVVYKDKETQEEKVGELNLPLTDVACFYKDSYGVFIVTHGGKSYKVKQTLQELEELL